MGDTPRGPVLATIRRVELGSVGTWNVSNIDGWQPTAHDFASAASAVDCPAVRRPTIKLGHFDGPGDPTLGVIDNMAVTDNGQTLVGDFVGVPGWMATADDHGRSVISSAYPDRSGEWEHNYRCQLGHRHPFVLHSMALLGVVRPGIGTLESLYDLYTKAPRRAVAAAASPISLDGIRRQFYATAPVSHWIREMFVDPPELIVQDDETGGLLRVAYTVAAGTAQFSTPQRITATYVAASVPTAAFGTRAQARRGIPDPHTALRLIAAARRGRAHRK